MPYTSFLRRILAEHRYLWVVLIACVLVSGCRRESVEELEGGYPEEIALILRETCATPGCHTGQSAAEAGGLNLETYNDLFKGCRGGSPIVPYSPELSFLLYSINTDTNLGSVLLPTMPLNQASLGIEEYNTLRQWIEEGARNASGVEAFPPVDGRKKWYVGHNDCDHVAVFDAESQQIMRYVAVGNNPGFVEEVADIQVTPDGEDWLLVFGNTNNYIQRYSSLTDEKVADIVLGNYFWDAVVFSPDSRLAFVSNNYWQKLAVVDLNTNSLLGSPTSFPEPILGTAVHPTRQEIYLIRHRNQGLYVLDYDNEGGLSNRREVDLVQNFPFEGAAGLAPQQIHFLPDGSKFFVTCWNSKEVRAYDGQTNALLEIISVPTPPQKMAYSATTDHLFVSCTNDTLSWGGEAFKRGSVIAINATQLTTEKVIYSGFQPHAMWVDEANGLLVVPNRNNNVLGPASHHASSCGDKNGYVTLIDLQTLELIPDYKSEILADPIAIGGN